MQGTGPRLDPLDLCYSASCQDAPSSSVSQPGALSSEVVGSASRGVVTGEIRVAVVV